MSYDVGLDVALRSVSACVIDNEGEFVKETKLDSDVEAIVAWLEPVRDEIDVVGLEAGTPPKLKHGAFDDPVRDKIEADPALSLALLPLLDAQLVLYRTFLEMDRRARKMAREDAMC